MIGRYRCEMGLEWMTGRPGEVGDERVEETGVKGPSVEGVLKLLSSKVLLVGTLLSEGKTALMTGRVKRPTRPS
jgi:hypothetical protein